MDQTSQTMIRAEELGKLMREVRLSAGKSMKDCALAIGVSRSNYSAYEQGKKSLSMPQLEVLAFYIMIPMEFFLDGQTIKKSDTLLDDVEKLAQLITLRQKIIGVMLRKARVEANLTLEDIIYLVDISEEQLISYEFGETPIPLPDLELLATTYNLSIKEFQGVKGPIGKWVAQQKAINGFLDLPDDLQKFVELPVNRLYLEVAERLSQMDVDKLRAVAEGLLEITL